MSQPLRTGNILAATAVAIVCILLVAARRWRLRPGDVAGYWRPVKDDEGTGGEYSVGAPTGSAGGAVFSVRGREAPAAPVVAAVGDVRFPRRVCVGARCGTLDLSGRHLDWGHGERWVREGVFHCVSCVE